MQTTTQPPISTSPTLRKATVPVTVAIAAGGTGGHIYPGLAVAEAVRAERPDARVIFIGTSYGMESELIPAAGFPLALLNMIPFSRRAGWRQYVAPLITARAAWQGRRLLEREAVDVVVGMGGYPSLPAVAGARLAGVPAVIHEANAVPGKANRLSALMTRNVALAMSGEGCWHPHSGAVVVGTPVSPELQRLDRGLSRADARERLGVDADTRLVVVSGGSQGAARLDEVAVKLAASWLERGDVKLLIKASRGTSEALREQIAVVGASHIAEVVAYFERMSDVYAAADLMITRAGAATVAELATIGVPAILVPYPHAPADHQTHNARALVEAGSALLVTDDDEAAAAVRQHVNHLLGHPDRLAAMAASDSRSMPRDGAGRLARWALELAKENA